jgi:hypothetical protein
MQGVFIAVVAGGPRLGDVRAGATAAASTPEFSWVAGGLMCIVVVAVVGYLVRPFWRYDTRMTEPADVLATAVEASAPPPSEGPTSGR